MALTFERRKTSKQRLRIDWDHPASIDLPADDGGGGTRAQVRMYAVTREEAFARLCGDDLRPLLVVRECNKCKGTDDALLSRTLDNERTLLLARWFHCVKLRHHVLEQDHTFHQLFTGDAPPHLFLALADGSNVVPLPGTQSQSELWGSMLRVLDLAYERDARQALEEMNRLLTTYDHLDSLEDMLAEQVDAAVEKHGPDSAKVARLRAKLDKVRAQKTAALAREKEVADLGLRRGKART